MTNKKFKRMTENEFKQLKTLLDVGVSRVQVKKITGRSYLTVSMVNNARTFEDYKEAIVDHAQTRKNTPTKAQRSFAERMGLTGKTKSGHVWVDTSTEARLALMDKKLDQIIDLVSTKY